jgi:hypothetical protein
LNNIDREEEGYRSKTLDDVITKDVLDQGVNGFEDNKSSVNCFEDMGFGDDDRYVFELEKRRVQDTV